MSLGCELGHVTYLQQAPPCCPLAQAFQRTGAVLLWVGISEDPLPWALMLHPGEPPGQARTSCGSHNSTVWVCLFAGPASLQTRSGGFH